MIMYKLTKDSDGNVCGAINLQTFGQFPFDPANTDYQNFKKEVLAGAELQDADGDVMSQKDAEAFINSLP